MSLAGKSERWVNWNDPIYLQKIITESKSKTEIIKKIGYTRNSNVIKKLNFAIKKFNLNTSTLFRNINKWENLPNIINECYSLTDILKKMGLEPRGGNSKTAKKYIKYYNLDISHFKKFAPIGPNEYSIDEAFCENSKVSSKSIKTKLIKFNLLEYKCNKCGISDNWLGEKLVLQLEHINGISNDNRLSNLTFLCPNCHSQTPTFCGRKNKINRV